MFKVPARVNKISLRPTPIVGPRFNSRFTTESNPVTTDAQTVYEIAAPRHPSDARKSKLLNFTTDIELRARYVNPVGAIRFGLILEELDNMAGIIAYKHTIPPTAHHLLSQIDKRLSKPKFFMTEPLKKFESPITIVTASCNRIELFSPLTPEQDLQIDGQVTWVGRSSMEIQLTVDTVKPTTKERVIEAYFTMVARDHEKNKAVEVPALLPQNEVENLLFNEGAKRAQSRKAAAKLSLEKMPPSDEERQLVHDLYLQTRKLKFNDGTYAKMGCQESRMEAAIFMQPQERNIHGKIFGGYLMRKAFELAWTTAYVYTGMRPTFKAIDEIFFLEPVSIGDIASFKSEVVYTQDNMVQIAVTADVILPESHTTKTTNIFHISFSFPQVKEVKKIVPSSYEEVIKYVDGRRRLLKINLHELHW